MPGGFRRPMHGGFQKRPMHGEKRGKWSIEEIKKKLDAAIKSGEITQEQADAKLKELDQKESQ